MNSLLCKATEEIPYTIYYGTFVHTPALGKLEILLSTAVGVDDKGTIDFISSDLTDISSADDILQLCRDKVNPEIDLSCIKTLSIIDQPASFFFPGFIDTHLHASQYPNTGLGVGTPLLDWLNEYTFPMESMFTASNIDQASAIYSAVISRTLNSGTTTVLYFTTIDVETTKLFADLALQYGQRAFVGQVCMDHNECYPSYSLGVQETSDSMNELISHISERNPVGEVLSTPIITPRFALTCLEQMLQYLGKLSAEKKLPVQTHISENLGEIAEVKKQFPQMGNYALVYDAFGLLHETTILAHAIHLTPDERRLIKDRNCSISHCPQSNTFIKSGQAPIIKYLYEDEINVSLGTDISGGYGASILSIARESLVVSHHLSFQAVKDSPTVSVADALYMATQGGARAVGMTNLVGLFQVGKRFDAQMIDLQSKSSLLDIFDFQKPTHQDVTAHSLEQQKKEIITKKTIALVHKWFFCGDDRNCVNVWCNGRQVVAKA